MTWLSVYLADRTSDPIGFIIPTGTCGIIEFTFSPAITDSL